MLRRMGTVTKIPLEQSAPFRLRGWIARSKFSRDMDAAEFLGIHPVELSRLLGGIRKPTLEQASRIARLTGIPAETWVLDIED